MHIITYQCPTCGTVVAANELEARRIMKCPGLDCGAVVRFDDLPEDDRQHFLDHREQYRI
ncbi:MAG: hypothetical protein ABEI77_04695 [Halorientalis sp.]